MSRRSDAVRVQFPKKLNFLFQRHRYKVARGGRGSAKSWTFARALLILGGQRPLRIGCAREVQDSIKQSVHRLLQDQIPKVGLSGFYSVQQSVIRGANGTEFVFFGLSDQTVDSIKSFEGMDIVWVEEANVVTKRSWDILIPTIRRESSEIWATFNPELDTDDTYMRFVENPPAAEAPLDCVSVEMNWRDNPWFGEPLASERIYAERTFSKVDYENIWEGKPRPAVSGAIYADEVADMFTEHRVTEVPYDPFLVVHVIFDLGWNDHMAIGLAQQHLSTLRLIGYIEDRHHTLEWYTKKLRENDYTWGTVFIPHDGGHANIQTGKTSKQILEDLKWRDVQVLENQDVSEGIRVARMQFRNLYIDKTKCTRLVECLKRYRRAVSKQTGEAGHAVHDEFSHGADMYRYAAMAAPYMNSMAAMSGMQQIKYPKNTGIV